MEVIYIKSIFPFAYFKLLFKFIYSPCTPFACQMQEQILLFYERCSFARTIDQWENESNQPENLKMSAEAKKNYPDMLEDQRKLLAGLNKDPQLDGSITRCKFTRLIWKKSGSSCFGGRFLPFNF